MDFDIQKTRKLVLRDSLHPHLATWMRNVDFVWMFVGITAVMLNHSVRASQRVERPWEFPAIIFAALVWLTASLVVQYRWSLARETFRRRHRLAAVVSVAWLGGSVIVIIIGPALVKWTSQAVGRGEGLIAVAEIALLARGAAGLLSGLRGAAAASTWNPALLLVSTFLGFVAVGTALLMFPRARVQTADAPMAGAPFLTALFTATSAACVNGLVVEETPQYWSRDGQVVILCLFQVGGLGIMTFGAFFGLLAGRNIGVREHATLGDILESEGLGNVRRLVMAILGLTFSLELIGAVLLSGLWSDQPLGEQVFQSLFHSVSGFCNAGFVLTDDSFLGEAHRWQVWGVLAGLIILGGIGFAVLSDVGHFVLNKFRDQHASRSFLQQRPVRRLALTSRLVLIASGILLAGGTLGVLMLEQAAAVKGRSEIPLADAWFLSVTLRSGGFHTVDVGSLHPTTKLLSILLMFIGASPGSTGGGVRTVVLSVTVLGLLSVLRGRPHIECFGRTLPDALVFRALAVIFLSLALIMITTILLVLYEDNATYFLDYMFEAASAVGTVGISSTIPVEGGGVISVTQSLSSPSRMVIIVAMFLGRVGPLTLLIALAGQTTSATYQYPEERVMLG